MTRQAFLKLCSLLLAGSALPFAAKIPKATMPALFFGHGSPMNIIQNNDYTNMLKQTAKQIPNPLAILIISAHWEENDTLLSTTGDTQTIYDFGGFPQALYEVDYAAKGSQYLASMLNIKTTNRGLDHGAWSILTHMYPNANIPTMQLSINRSLSLEEHFMLGKRLESLRAHSVLIIGSGSITHNLRSRDGNAENAAKTFDSFVKKTILSNDLQMLTTPIHANIPLWDVHPTLEHYIPLLYIAGIASVSQNHKFIFEGFQDTVISMRAWLIE